MSPAVVRRLAVGLPLLLLSTACGGGLPMPGAPSDPIAFVRQEAAKGLLSLDAFRQGLQMRAFETGAEEHVPRLRTTLSLLVVPTGRVEAVPGSWAGALPMDWSADGSRLLIARRAARDPARLVTWNRHTGVYDRIHLPGGLGGAALGDGPIRLATVARVVLPDGRRASGVILDTDAGGGPQSLPGAAPGSEPDVAPDGRSVVFVRPSEGRDSRGPRILLSRLEGSEPRDLGRGDTPRFSRDGHWIVFTRTRNRSRNVWLMRADGSGKRRVTDSGYDEESPAISEHGGYVVYASVRGMKDESQLFLTRVADGEEIQLTRNGQNGRPVW